MMEAVLLYTYCFIFTTLATTKNLNVLGLHSYARYKKQLYHSLSAFTGDNPLTNVRGLSPRTGGQTMVYLLLKLYGCTSIIPHVT